ncbi:MAG: polysaccharide deacetylase family protein [Clostridiaceae bacterium]|nr:polysaccharide deacetylase family protein [Clostridiaceae bacterium]
MTKRYFLIFLAAVILTAALLAGFNAAIDPFGIFGDRLLSWWSYDMTQNPRTAKIGYLDEHHEDYNAYMIGCSKTSSLPTDKLNALYGASFYNMFMYGGDLYDVEKTTAYVLANYGARHIVVNIGFDELMDYENESDNTKGNLHAKVDGSNLALFYAKYLFSNPEYALNKLIAYAKNGYLVNENRVFDVETGAYDKSLRDVEPISSMESYLDKYPDFNTAQTAITAMPDVQACLDSIARMKATCESYGATFTLIISPMYCNDLNRYVCDDLFDFLIRLADITDYWDFNGYTEVSYEPRWFYDTTHPRNAVGEMALAVMAGDTSVYVPEGFGVHVTAANAAELGRYEREDNAAAHEVKVPVLMYHHISDTFKSVSTVTTETFRAQMQALADAGYQAVTFADLIAYVDNGTELPSNPIVITFDDGYASNLEIAAPVLEKLGFRADITVIGKSIGEGVETLPHFSLEDVKPWVERGVLEIGAHSYGLHDTKPRLGVYRMSGESEKAYVAAFTADTQAVTDAITQGLGVRPTVYSYPYGYHTDITEVILSQMGYRVTLTVANGINTIVKGLSQSLRALKRYNVTESMTPAELIEGLKGLK